MDVHKGKTTINAEKYHHSTWLHLRPQKTNLLYYRRPPFAPFFSKRDTRPSRSSLILVLIRAVILSTISSAIVNTLVNYGTAVKFRTDQQNVTYEHHRRIAPRNHNADTCFGRAVDRKGVRALHLFKYPQGVVIKQCELIYLKVATGTAKFYSKSGASSVIN